MREIKFRAWSPSAGIMLDNVDIEDQKPVQSGYMFYTQPIDDLIIMQFTGLKDIDGVDIYEGDILSHVEFDIAGRPILTKVDQVEFVPAMFICGKIQLKGFQVEIYSFEVIGNIHESPELLSDS